MKGYRCPCGGKGLTACGEYCDILVKAAGNNPKRSAHVYIEVNNCIHVVMTWIRLMRISDNSFMGDLNLPLKINKLPDGAGYEVTCPYYATEAWSAPKEQDAIRMAKHGLEEMASKRTMQAKPRWMSEWSGRGPTKDDDVASPEATEGVPVPLD